MRSLREHADAAHHEVHHHGGPRSGATQPGFDDREARLHEHDQKPQSSVQPKLRQSCLRQLIQHAGCIRLTLAPLTALPSRPGRAVRIAIRSIDRPTAASRSASVSLWRFAAARRQRRLPRGLGAPGARGPHPRGS